jgi:hypothetical protein
MSLLIYLLISNAVSLKQDKSILFSKIGMNNLTQEKYTSSNSKYNLVLIFVRALLCDIILGINILITLHSGGYINLHIIALSSYLIFLNGIIDWSHIFKYQSIKYIESNSIVNNEESKNITKNLKSFYNNIFTDLFGKKGLSKHIPHNTDLTISNLYQKPEVNLQEAIRTELLKFTFYSEKIAELNVDYTPAPSNLTDLCIELYYEIPEYSDITFSEIHQLQNEIYNGSEEIKSFREDASKIFLALIHIDNMQHHIIKNPILYKMGQEEL